MSGDDADRLDRCGACADGSASRRRASLGCTPARDRDRRGGVERIVAPRHRQGEIGNSVNLGAGAVAEHDGEARAAVGMFEPGEPHVGLGIFAVGDDAVF